MVVLIYVSMATRGCAAEPAKAVQGSKAPMPAKAGTLQYDYSAHYEDKDFRVSVRSAQPWTPGESSLSVIVVKRPGLPEREVTLPRNEGMVKRIMRVAPDKFVVIEGSTAPYSGVILVDIPNMRVIEDFVCYNPILSPNNRYLAFVRMFPAHFLEDDDEASNFMMLYDFSRSPSFNREPQSFVRWNRSGEEGRLVYPRHLKLTRWIRDPGRSVVHDFGARVYFSPDSTKLFFLDDRYPGNDDDPASQPATNVRASYHIPPRSALTYVMVNLAGPRPVTKVLPSPDCAAAAGKGCDTTLIGAAFGKVSVTATLRTAMEGKDQSSVLDYAAFRLY
jgi:hypothetical protein